jgi:hypothetical protein
LERGKETITGQRNLIGLFMELGELLPGPDDDGTPSSETLHLFVDEAGDPNLFHASGKNIVGSPGCSEFFLLGKAEVDDPSTLETKLQELRHELLHDPYFAGVQSFRPERKKTALHFHAKDDLSEVRYRVFKLLVEQGKSIRFHAVVCDKQRLAEIEIAKRKKAPTYRYQPNALYDSLVCSLFEKFHRLADRYSLCVAKRGSKDRNHAIAAALEQAERAFESKFGFSRGGKDVWTIQIGDPRKDVCLQAADYFLWAVQRFYEKRLHPETGEELREDRYLNLLWPQIAEIHDLHFGPSHGTFFNAQKPLTLAERFALKTRKKKKP